MTLFSLKGKFKSKTLALEDVKKLQEFLMNFPSFEAESHLHRRREDLQPVLSLGQANSVIWYLQEIMRVIPHRFIRCDGCGNLFEDEQNCCSCGYQNAPEIRP